jgi:hypothetical protein
MPIRSPKSVWSDDELCLIKYVLSLYPHRGVNYEHVVYLFKNRTVQEIKKRCSCVRDQARRKERSRCIDVVKPKPFSSIATIQRELVVDTPPYEGQLHPTLVWVPTTGVDIGYMIL